MFCHNVAKDTPTLHRLLNDEKLKAKNAYFFRKDVHTKFIRTNPISLHNLDQTTETLQFYNHDVMGAINGVPLYNKGLNLYFSLTLPSNKRKIEKSYKEYGLYMKLARELPITIYKFHLLYQPRTIDPIQSDNILHL